MRRGTSGLASNVARMLAIGLVATSLLGAGNLRAAAAMDEARRADLEARRARMHAEFRQLHAVRRDRRADVLSIPGVIGIGTETRDNQTRACITVYVLRETAEVRAAIESRLGDVPLEIIEKPGGFRAY